MTRRLFGEAGFVQVILTSAGNLAPPDHFVDMILRRPNHGAGIWICLTKMKRGNLNGSLDLGGTQSVHQQGRFVTIRRLIYSLTLDGLLMAVDRNLASHWVKTCDVSP